MTAAARCALNAKRAVLGGPRGLRGPGRGAAVASAGRLGAHRWHGGQAQSAAAEWAQAAAESGVEHRSQRLADAAMHEGAGGGPAAALAARHGWEPHRKLAAATEPTKQPHTV